MKTTFSLIALIALCPFALAGTLSFTNQINGAAGDTVIVDADGTVISGGIATGGFFNSGYDVNEGLRLATTSGDFSDFLANFNILASAAIAASGDSGFDGFYVGGVDYGAPTGNPFIGAELFSILGNASSLTSSTQFAVLMSSDIVDADVPLPDSNSIALGFDTTTLLGTAGTSSFDFGNGLESTPSLALVRAIPEPSALLLSAFGALALLRRKR